MEDLYPLFVYYYDAQGFYREPKRIANEQELKAAIEGPVKQHVEKKLEVVITDGGDLLCFHAYNGHIKWDSKKRHECEGCKEPPGRR